MLYKRGEGFLIRKLDEQDRKKVLDYVGKEPNINLFIIGDIEQFGFNQDFQELWGKFNEEDKLEGVLLRYNNNFIPYYENIKEHIIEFEDIVESYKGDKFVSGQEDIINNFERVLAKSRRKNTYLCELKEKNIYLTWDESVKLAKPEDAKKIADLLNTIDEFISEPDDNRIEEEIRNKSKRVYYIENKEKEIISIAQTTAENSKSAMIVGVATRKEYREQGHMSKCLSKLCNDLIDEGKSLCLFYDNPKAGRVYHKLGFKEIGKWTMLIEKN